MATPEHPKKLIADLKAVVAANPDRLSDWEKTFASDLKERFEKWGEGVFLSDRQKSTIQKIAAELRGEKTVRGKPAAVQIDSGDIPEFEPGDEAYE